MGTLGLFGVILGFTALVVGFIVIAYVIIKY